MEGFKTRCLTHTYIILFYFYILNAIRVYFLIYLHIVFILD